MTRVDLHPEALFDSLRAGDLDDEQRAQLRAHCAYCEPCLLELRLIEDAPLVGDDALQNDKLAAAAIRGLFLPEPVGNPALRSRTRNKARAFSLVAAGVVLGCSLGAAAMVTRYPANWARAVFGWISATETTLSSASHAGRETAGVATENAAAKPGAALTAAKPAASSAAEAKLASRPSAAGLSPVPDSSRQKSGARPARDALDAEQALSLATKARALGQQTIAAKRYQFVIERFPASREASAARVALGRLLYADLAQPAAALPWFDAYLARNPRGELAEETMYYRALCLSRLQRVSEARASFSELLATYPHSLYAARARTYLSSGIAQ
jgi:TolA-binding protein